MTPRLFRILGRCEKPAADVASVWADDGVRRPVGEQSNSVEKLINGVRDIRTSLLSVARGRV